MTDLAREYGEGLYDLAVEEKTTAELLGQLQSLKAIFREQPDFLKLLSNRSISRGERFTVMDSVLKGQIDPYLLNFLKLLCERDALSEFDGCEAVFHELYNRDNGITVAVVTTSAPLKEAQRAALIRKLETMSGHQIELDERKDPSVLGGVSLEMDGRRYDNTVRGRLEEIRRAMTADL